MRHVALSIPEQPVGIESTSGWEKTSYTSLFHSVWLHTFVIYSWTKLLGIIWLNSGCLFSLFHCPTKVNLVCMQWAQQLPRVSREDANLQKDTSWVIPLGEPGDESAQLRQMTEYNLSVDLSATGLPVNFSAISPNTLYAAQVKKTRKRGVCCRFWEFKRGSNTLQPSLANLSLPALEERGMWILPLFWY